MFSWKLYKKLNQASVKTLLLVDSRALVKFIIEFIYSNKCGNFSFLYTIIGLHFDSTFTNVARTSFAQKVSDVHAI